MEGRSQLVSVIVPVYNVAQYVEDCIESIIGQTYTNLEIIIVDDGSKDESAKLCDKYSALDSRVKVIHQKNQGVSVARNTGIEIAKGDWLTFVDGDDYLDSRIIENLLKLENGDNCDICVCSYFLLNDDREEKAAQSYFYEEYNDYTESDTEKLITNCLFNRAYGNTAAETNVGVPWGKLYNRNFIIGNNLRFIPGLKRMQDTVFNIEAFIKARIIRYKNVPGYFYRVWNGSAVRKYSPDFSSTAVRFLESVKEKLKAFNGSELVWTAFDSKAVALFFECIKLQYVHPQCTKSFKEKAREIRTIANKPIFYKAFRDCNNIYLSKWQKLYLKLIIKNQFSFLLLLMMVKNKIKNN